MNILKLIKERRTIRKYKDKTIPKNIIDKIIEAGIWGPSLLGVGFQPWEFFVIENRAVIKKISDTLFKRAETAGIGGNAILRISATTIANASIVIAVYNSACVTGLAKKINRLYIKLAKAAELSAISAAIQNMVLTADTLKIGSCWLDAPLFCKKEINNILMTNNELVAILTLGYPAQKGKRSPRKSIAETVKYIK